MRRKQVEDEPKTFVLIFETGDETATWRGTSKRTL